MEEVKHIPGQVEADDFIPADDQEDDAEDEFKGSFEEESEDLEEEATEEPQEDEEEKPKEESENDEESEGEDQEEPPEVKKRSIYQDLKEKKQEVKESKQIIAEKDAEIARLNALVSAQNNAETDAEKAKAQEEIDAEIASIAEEEGISLESAKKVFERAKEKYQIKEEESAPEKPAEQEAEEEEEPDETALAQKRQSEDQATLKELDSAWKSEKFKTLGLPEITDPKEKAEVEAEVVRLSHTDKYHDKSISYILFEEAETLKKMISPKRPSFEGGGNSTQEGNTTDTLEVSGKTTPEELSKISHSVQKSNLTIQKSR